MILYDNVYKMDCIEGMKSILDASVDLVVTDPPYLIDYHSARRSDKSHKFCSSIANDNNPDLVADYIKECYRILKDNTAMYMFCSSKTLDTFMELSKDAGFSIKNVIVWVKNSWTAGDLAAQFGQQYEPILLLNKGRCPFNGKRITDVWQFSRVAGNELVHQNQKPLSVIEQCIEKHSARGGVVFDGFMGSGTTAVACINTGRRYIGFELDEQYYDVCQKRIATAKASPLLF